MSPQGEKAASFHNRYPQAWAQLAQEAVAEAQALRGGGQSEVVFFTRSAWTQSPGAVPVFWLGDQLISWDANDGLKSVVTGALSSGLTGHAITHSDIGGYTVETIDPSMYYVRSPELLQRWTELAAFGFGMRTFGASLRASSDRGCCLQVCSAPT